ncbi:MAG TPA: class I SAM-dependent methyltransferase [Acidimicrobiales bacterium]|nr:class I SAM-dependent methyltransferase [Acidimicrobiales bacterium]
MSTAGRTVTAGPPRPARAGGPPRTAGDAGSPGDAGTAGRRPIGLAPGAPAEAAGQDAAKYGSSNPVVRRFLDRWAARLRAVVGPLDGTVVDVGVGEGLCLERLLEPGGPPGHVVGVEYRLDKARVARRLAGVSPVVADAGMLPLSDRRADVVTCIEVLEHLPAVAPAVAELARVTTDRCVVSVPWEPWFRLGNLGRGKNVRRLGNDPEHVQWFTPRRLRLALDSSFTEVRVVRAFPWIIAEARRPR